MARFLGFTLDQAARLSGLSAERLRYWDETDFFKPSYRNEAGRPFGRVYAFRDVVGLRTLGILRDTHHVSLQSLRRAADWLREHYDAPWSTLRFYVAGREVYFHDPTLDVHRSATHPERAVIPIDLQEVASATESAANRLRERSCEEIGQIVHRRYVSHNAPIIAGTRIRTEAIWNFHVAGYDTPSILRQYPRLSEEDIAAAIQFERYRHAAMDAIGFLVDENVPAPVTTFLKARGHTVYAVAESFTKSSPDSLLVSAAEING